MYLPVPILEKQARQRLAKAFLADPPPEGTVYRNYYYTGGQRVALRETTSSGSAVYYLLGDHLGSTSIVANSTGNKLSELRYKPWGGLRYAEGEAHTSYLFTGQRFTSLGLYFFNARWFDQSLGRFAQADTIVPLVSQGILAWDHYALVNNNPVRFNDPTGHMCNDPEAPTRRCDGGPNRNYFGNKKPQPSTSPIRKPATVDGIRHLVQSPQRPEFSLDKILERKKEEFDQSPLDDGEGESANPPLEILVPIGLTFTSASLFVEGAILYTELVALPTVAIAGPATVTLEISLGAVGIIVLDANIAYWSYVYRVIEEPDITQTVELLPPWGFGH